MAQVIAHPHPAHLDPKLFHLFHCARNVGKIEGTGLGLTVVKKCLEQMGGQIHIASQTE